MSAYRIMFAKDKAIEKAVTDTSFRIASIIRNVQVHVAGVVDQEFMNQVQGDLGVELERVVGKPGLHLPIQPQGDGVRELLDEMMAAAKLLVENVLAHVAA